MVWTMVAMDPKVLRERDFIVDLESGATTSEEGPREDTANPGVKPAKKLLSRVWSGFTTADGWVRGEGTGNVGNGFPISIESPIEKVESIADKKFGGREENVGLSQNKLGTEMPKKKTTCKKPPKPPRPPRAPSLDAADQKLVREITEFAMLKRARVERMKALKKAKNAKAASSNSSWCALVVTILFCLVILWQGLCSRSSSNVRFEGSPESSVGRGGLISVQYFRNVSTSDSNGSGSSSPNIVEQVSGLDSQAEASRVAG